MKNRARFWTAVAVATGLWFYMFSPWTGYLTNFWLNMSLSALVLASIAVCDGVRSGTFIKTERQSSVSQLLFGILIAFALWGVFWIGDKLSQLMFDFARPQVDSVYGMKDGTSATLIAFLLLFLIGPAEELFWRGYVQRHFSDSLGATPAMFVTVMLYASVHIWSMNFMLVMAALVAGGVWGLLYRIRPSLLPAIVVSHAVWDALVFVIMPI